MRDLDKVYTARELPKRYDGLICTFDLDKTYLATEFETLSGLVKIPFESAEEKQNIPGAAAVVRELRRPSRKNRPPTPLYFISGSPKQLENVIREKLELDGVTCDGILFKDFKSAIKRFQFKKLIDKIGFKLGGLLYGRIHHPLRSRELLFGDDSEYDATIYSLYADIIAGRLETFEILTILKKWDVAEDEIRLIENSLEALKGRKFKSNAVEKIFIHLEVGSKPVDHMSLSRLVTPTRNYFQTALILYNMEYITRAGLFRVISDLIRIYNFSIKEFAVSTEDLIRRGLIDKKESRRLLKIISKGNPLALTGHWLRDLSIEISRIVESTSFIPAGRSEETDETSLVERYLRHTPTRRV